MKDHNSVTLTGRLTHAPEGKQVGDKQAAKFSLAVNDSYKGKDGEQVEKTCFIDVDTWGRTAENVCAYLSKGSQVLVSGRLQLDRWEDKQGNKRSKHKVVAQTVQFLGGKNSTDGGDTANDGGSVVDEIDDVLDF